MIYITGDTHGDFSRFEMGNFPRQKDMTRDDHVIICGDFGGVWNESREQAAALDCLNDRPFTTLFLDGNHENYDLLAAYPEDDWHGGKVQFIREHVIHLMRGQVYEIDGQTFFTMGGAACHDIQNGVINAEDGDYEAKVLEIKQRRRFYRINHMSWWEQELPSDSEINEAAATLCEYGKKVDYVLSHCAPASLQKKIQAVIGDDTHPENALTTFLQWVYDECGFKHWYCGHYHRPIRVNDRFEVLYRPIVSLDSAGRAGVDDLIAKLVAKLMAHGARPGKGRRFAERD